MNYLEETLKFIESDEMREHLRTTGLSRSKCAEIVACAPASLERKIPVLDLIATQTEPDSEEYKHNPVWLAEFARLALGSAQDSVIGCVFWVDGDRLFTNFNAAMRYVEEEYEGEPATIEKYIPTESGRLKRTFHWVIGSDSKIWYAMCELRRKNGLLKNFYDPIGNLNLHTPFEVGDIVIADCYPFLDEPALALIVKEDWGDCCSLWCIYINPDDTLDTGAFKHHAAFRGQDYTISPVSPLYRAARYHGELDETERPLGVLSEAIKAEPELAGRIDQYFSDKQDVRWEDLKNELKL